MFPYGHALQMAPRHQRGGWHEQSYAPRPEPRHEERYMSYEYEYRRPNVYQNPYAQPPNRYSAPGMMPRVSSGNHFSGHHLPQRSLTPYPERGHSEPPHYPHHPASNYSDHARQYPEASYGRGHSEGDDYRRRHEHDPYLQYGGPQEHRYPAMPMPQRRGGSWVGGQPPLDPRMRSTMMPDEHRSSRGRSRAPAYEDAEWDMQQHQRQKLERIGEVVDVEDHYTGSGHGRAPLMKGEWPEERYRGGHEEDSGYGSDEGESLVDDEWEGPDETLHHATPHHGPWPRKGDYGQSYEPGAPQEYYQRPSQWSQPNSMKFRDGWQR
ncbi:hypothetical protein EYR40_004928 [Pleurotus pulmonarius]|nr:hypothetical protein EYR36_006688 [Pleurotus pulmonarius]KAF4601385.1 hypothetical protein EYR38_006038 [Pleurotus pulmonarius]KAF4601729.1 hypothetical protein EYR40_004928 [Pleurotus pulmonarius]